MVFDFILFRYVEAHLAREDDSLCSAVAQAKRPWLLSSLRPPFAIAAPVPPAGVTVGRFLSKSVPAHAEIGPRSRASVADP